MSDGGMQKNKTEWRDIWRDWVICSFKQGGQGKKAFHI